MHNHPLIQKLSEFCTLPETLIPELLNSFKIIVIPKEKVLLREGFANRNVYFLHSGIIRRYYISQSGHQKTTAFITEHNFFTDLESFEKRKGSYTTFTTETECVVYSIDYYRLVALMEAHEEVREGFTKMKDYYCNFAAERREFLATAPVENRVKMMVEELPKVMEASRKKDIISYLRTNVQCYNFLLKNFLIGQ